MKNRTKKKVGSVAPEPTRSKRTRHRNDKQAMAIVAGSKKELNNNGPKAEGAPLSVREKASFHKCETEIRNGVKSIVDMCRALKTIRDEYLYREKFETFEDYLAQVHKMSRSYAYDLIRFYELRCSLSANGGPAILLPVNERQARPLARLKSEKQQKRAWKAAMKKAGENELTEAHVRQAVSALFPKKTEKKPTSEHTSNESDTSDTTPKPLGWVEARVNALLGDEYKPAFDEPLKWGGEEADVYSQEKNLYLKFIDHVDIENAFYAVALKASTANSYTIVNGATNKCVEQPAVANGEIPDLFCPHLNYFAKQAAIFVEYQGKLYESGEFVNGTGIVWKLATDEVVLGIFAAYTAKLTENQATLTA